MSMRSAVAGILFFFIATPGDSFAGQLVKSSFSDLPHHEFLAIYRDGSSQSFGPYTLAGPSLEDHVNIESSQPATPKRPKPPAKLIFDIAIDSNETSYGLRNHTVFEFPSSSQLVIPDSELQLDGMLSWPIGITYDSNRDRLLVATLGGVGHLLAYSPDDKRWQALSDLNHKDLSAIEYDQANDRLYGFQPNNNTTLYEYSPETGRLISSWSLEALAAPNLFDSHYRTPTQLIASRDQLILMRDPLDSPFQGEDEFLVFLLSPENREIVQVVPEPAAIYELFFLLAVSPLFFRNGAYQR